MAVRCPHKYSTLFLPGAISRRTSSDERDPNSLSARSIWVFHTFSPRATQAPSFHMAPSPVNHSVSFVLWKSLSEHGSATHQLLFRDPGRWDDVGGRYVRGVST